MFLRGPIAWDSDVSYRFFASGDFTEVLTTGGSGPERRRLLLHAKGIRAHVDVLARHTRLPPILQRQRDAAFRQTATEQLRFYDSPSGCIWYRHCHEHRT